jgi:hypothetical protein
MPGQLSRLQTLADHQLRDFTQCLEGENSVQATRQRPHDVRRNCK